MNKRPLKNEYNPFFERYISLVPEGNLLDILARQLQQTTALLSDVTESQGNYRYAEDKWSLKEVIGHVADNERIMSYRLLMIARGADIPLAGYDQDVLMRGSSFQAAAMAEITADFTAVRTATLTLLSGLSEEAWTRTGIANNSEVSVRALACILSGHELHHVKIIQDRYLA